MWQRFFFLMVLYTLPLGLINSQSVYRVGPAQDYSSIGAVPWESLVAGDTVLIYWRDTPYHEKWVINVQGQNNKWVTVKGVPNASGNLPVIDGQDATTRTQLNYWGEERGVIKIGGSNVPANEMPAFIRVENLEIMNAKSDYSFTGRDGLKNYSTNASAIFLEKGENIAIVNCTFTNCGNGFFSSFESKNVVVESCYFYDNGNTGSIYEHNSYTESQGIIFQYNHFGPLCSGCSGNNLKDRSAGTIIRFNWIESGNRQLDLVESYNDQVSGLESYHSSYVYGNVLIEPDAAGNGQICHYGGDGGEESTYRKGTLYFYNNTVVSWRTTNTSLLRLSTNSETSDCFNNIIYVSAQGNRLALLDSYGILNFKNNWLKTGWVESHNILYGTINNLGELVTSALPGFSDELNKDFSLEENSVCRDKGTLVPEAYPVNYEYKKHQNKISRINSGTIDLGAYEFKTATGLNSLKIGDIAIYPNPATEKVVIIGSVPMVKLNVYTMAGAKIANEYLLSSRFVFDCSKLARGSYIFKIETIRGSLSKMIILN